MPSRRAARNLSSARHNCAIIHLPRAVSARARARQTNPRAGPVSCSRKSIANQIGAGRPEDDLWAARVARVARVAPTNLRGAGRPAGRMSAAKCTCAPICAAGRRAARAHVGRAPETKARNGVSRVQWIISISLTRTRSGKGRGGRLHVDCISAHEERVFLSKNYDPLLGAVAQRLATARNGAPKMGEQMKRALGRPPFAWQRHETTANGQRAKSPAGR